MGRRRTSPIWKMESKQFQKLAKESDSLADIIRAFGFSPDAGHYRTVKKRIADEGIDISHIRLGLDSRLGKRFDGGAAPLEQLLVKNSTYDRGYVKRRIIKAGIVPYSCAECGRKPEWNGKELVLVLDHINGVNNDHRVENLRFLCPNCNSQTDTFAGRTKKQRYYCETCGRERRTKTARFCKRCVPKARRVKRPAIAVLKQEIADLGYCAVGRKYGVSDNAIRKWVQQAA